MGDRKSPVFLGAVGNFGIDSDKLEVTNADGEVTRVAEGDSIRVYLTARIDQEEVTLAARACQGGLIAGRPAVSGQRTGTRRAALVQPPLRRS